MCFACDAKIIEMNVEECNRCYTMFCLSCGLKLGTKENRDEFSDLWERTWEYDDDQLADEEKEINFDELLKDAYNEFERLYVKPHICKPKLGDAYNEYERLCVKQYMCKPKPDVSYTTCLYCCIEILKEEIGENTKDEIEKDIEEKNI